MRKEVLIPLLAVLLAIKFAIDNVGDTDLFWHLRLGLDLIEAGAMRARVLYTWTFDGDFPPFDWLSQVLMGGAYSLGGYLSLALFKAALAALLALCLYRAALLRSGHNVRAAGFAAGLMIIVAAANFSTRPLFLAHVLLAIEILLLEEARTNARRWTLVLLPPLFVLWGNIHGSWPFALGPIAVFAAESLLPLQLKFWRIGARFFRDSSPKLALFGGLAFVACILAQLLTPDPMRFLTRPFQWVGGGTEGVMEEWAAVPTNHPSFWFLLAVGGLLLVNLLRAKKPLPLFETLFVALAFGMALAKFRLIANFAIVGTPLLAAVLAPHISPEGFRSARNNAILAAAALLLLGGISLFNLSRVDEVAESVVPKSAVEALKASGKSQLPGFNYFDWGGFLVHQKIPTFIDGRLEPFESTGVLATYLQIERDADLSALEARGVAWILTRRDLPMAAALANADGWTRVHQSEDGSGAELWLREVP
ncbi:MAG: hypothetical protein LBM75_02160 [Myxococcales bacterium]|jgi:hypothetical protein|nr:hypothetical protein [Myxococcales bacterium]